ncbi:MAG: class II aldolase/adducin family protein, partial [Puniceicoccaceae bacterium]
MKDLRQTVHEATLQLLDNGLADCFRADVSGYDRRRSLVVIKPQEVDYSSLAPEKYLVISTQTGQVVEGVGTPSTGFSVHMALFRDLPDIRSVVAARSKYATMWAQAGRPIPCLGFSHADYFCGEIPITPPW